MPAGLAAITVGILLPAGAGLVDDGLVAVGSLILIVFALRIFRGSA